MLLTPDEQQLSIEELSAKAATKFLSANRLAKEKFAALPETRQDAVLEKTTIDELLEDQGFQGVPLEALKEAHNKKMFSFFMNGLPCGQMERVLSEEEFRASLERQERRLEFWGRTLNSTEIALLYRDTEFTQLEIRALAYLECPNMAKVAQDRMNLPQAVVTAALEGDKKREEAQQKTERERWYKASPKGQRQELIDLITSCAEADGHTGWHIGIGTGFIIIKDVNKKDCDTVLAFTQDIVTSSGVEGLSTEKTPRGVYIRGPFDKDPFRSFLKTRLEQSTPKETKEIAVQPSLGALNLK